MPYMNQRRIVGGEGKFFPVEYSHRRNRIPHTRKVNINVSAIRLLKLFRDRSVFLLVAFAEYFLGIRYEVLATSLQ
jgi:hypothetical protein